MVEVINAKESTRLIYDMKERGYAMSWQAQRYGVTPGQITHWVQSGRIRPHRAERIAALYAETLGTNRAVSFEPKCFRQPAPITAETEKQILELTASGVTVPNIVAMAGVGTRIVQRVQRQHNVQRGRGRTFSVRRTRDDYDWVVPYRIYSGHGRRLDPTFPEIRELFAMAERDELSDVQLGDRIGRPPRTIGRWRKELSQAAV